MKKILIIVLSAVIIVILGLHIKTYFEKPIIKTENSLDTNTKGIAPLNQEFWIEKNSTKSLLIVHGLAASPYQTRDLALFLSEKNITIYSIRITGHGTNIFDLEKSSYNDWYNDVKKAYDLLKSKDKQVYVLGVSVGALLTLNLAEQETPDGIIVIAPSLELKNKLSKFSNILKYFKRYHYSGIDSTQEGRAYENLPIKTIADLLHGAKKTKPELTRIVSPTLIIQSLNDQVVNPESSYYVLDSISTNKKKLITTFINHAVIRPYPTDTDKDTEERNKIFEDIYSFIENES